MTKGWPALALVATMALIAGFAGPIAAARDLVWNPYRSCSDQLLDPSAPGERRKLMHQMLEEALEESRQNYIAFSEGLFEATKELYEQDTGNAVSPEIEPLLRQAADLKMLASTAIFDDALARTFYRFGATDEKTIRDVLEKTKALNGQYRSRFQHDFAAEFIRQVADQVSYLADLFIRFERQTMAKKFGVSEAQVDVLANVVARFSAGDAVVAQALVLEHIGMLDLELTLKRVKTSLRERKQAIRARVSQREDRRAVIQSLRSDELARAALDEKSAVPDSVFRSALASWKGVNAAYYYGIKHRGAQWWGLFAAIGTSANLLLNYAFGVTPEAALFMGQFIAPMVTTSVAQMIVHRTTALKFPIALERLSRDQLGRLSLELDVLKRRVDELPEDRLEWHSGMTAERSEGRRWKESLNEFARLVRQRIETVRAIEVR